MSSKTTPDDKSDAQDQPDDQDQARPDDCQCWDADLDLPCFECYKEGFESQNPAEPGADDSEDEESSQDEQTTLADAGAEGV